MGHDACGAGALTVSPASEADAQILRLFRFGLTIGLMLLLLIWAPPASIKTDA